MVVKGTEGRPAPCAHTCMNRARIQTAASACSPLGGGRSSWLYCVFWLNCRSRPSGPPGEGHSCGEELVS